MRSLQESALVSGLSGRPGETCLLCAGLGACAMGVPSVLGGASVALAAILLAAWAGVPLRTYGRILAGASGFAMVSLLPLSVSIQAVAPRFAFDPEGFRTGIQALARAVGTLSATLLLSCTVPFHKVVAVLRGLGCPATATDLLSLVHREIFLLDGVFHRLRQALSARGGWSSLHRTPRDLALVLATLLPASLSRAQRLEQGLAARGSLDGDVVFLQEPIRGTFVGFCLAASLPALLALLATWGGSRLGF